MSLFGFGLPSYDMATPRGVFSLLLAMLAVGLCMYVAASVVVKRREWAKAMAAGAFGLVAAQLVTVAVNVDILGFLLGLVAFALVAALFYRKKLVEGVALGAVAWITWIVASILLGYLQAHWH